MTLMAGFARNECDPLSAVYKFPGFVSGPGGNLYKALGHRQIAWNEANDEAQALAEECGVNLHLATISSLEEDILVHQLARRNHLYVLRKSYWIGGFQNVDSPDFQEPDGGWEWLNNEGPISGEYENWGPDEPNDNRFQGHFNPDKKPEDHLTVGRYDTQRIVDNGKATGWNDEIIVEYISGYIVEVEVEPTVIIDGCDSQVENLRVPSAWYSECPMRPISTLIGLDGCMKYQHPHSSISLFHPDAFPECVTQIANRLRDADLISDEENDKMLARVVATET